MFLILEKTIRYENLKERHPFAIGESYDVSSKIVDFADTEEETISKLEQIANNNGYNLVNSLAREYILEESIDNDSLKIEKTLFYREVKKDISLFKVTIMS